MADPIALIGSLTEPITKLIETTSNGIGTLYEPTRIRKKAEAEAHAATVQAHSEVKVARIRVEGERELAELADRANERLAAKELRRQGNIEAIVTKAAHQLPDSVSKQPVDADWAVQFFNYAEDIGNEEVQFIWAGILAGEVNQPGASRCEHCIPYVCWALMTRDYFDAYARTSGEPGRMLADIWGVPRRTNT